MIGIVHMIPITHYAPIPSTQIAQHFVLQNKWPLSLPFFRSGREQDIKNPKSLKDLSISAEFWPTINNDFKKNNS